MPTYQSKLKPIATPSYASKLKPIAPVAAPAAPAPKTYSLTPLGAAERYGDTVAGAAHGSADYANAGKAQYESTPWAQPLKKLNGLLKFGSGVAGVVASPVAPVFHPLGAAIQKAGEGYGSIPAVQKFSTTPLGQRTAEAAQVVQDVSNITNTALGAKAVVDRAPGAIQSVKDTATSVKNTVMRTPKAPADGISPKAPKLVDQRVSELSKLEANNAGVRRVIGKHSERGIDSKKLLAETDLLHEAVDNTGTIRTQPAITELTDFIKPHEDVISKNLAKEGVKIPMKTVEDRLTRTIDESGLEADALEAAHSKLETTMKGLARRADPDGNISLSKIHDAKVSKYATVDYLNPAAKMADKAIARTFKELVEEHTKSVDVKALNKELSEHFAVLDLLEKLDGKKVEGGRLGRYFAKTVGAMVGGHFGPLGAIAGAEIAGRVKGTSMSRTFNGKSGLRMETSEAMKRAVQQGADQSSNTLADRNQSQSPTMTATTIPPKTDIPPTVPQPEAALPTLVDKAKGVIDTIKREGNKGFARVPGLGDRKPTSSPLGGRKSGPLGKNTTGKYGPEVKAFIGRQPEIGLLDDLERFIDSQRRGTVPEEYAKLGDKGHTTFSADLRDALSKFKVDTTRFKNDAQLADFAEEVLQAANATK